MDTRIKLQLGLEYEPGELNKATTNCLTCDFLVDTLKSVIRDYHQKCDMTAFMEKYDEMVSGFYSVAFQTMEDWIEYKGLAITAMLVVIRDIDNYVASQGIEQAGNLTANIQSKLNNFVLSLIPINITSEYADFSIAKIDKKYIDSAVEQLKFVNEGIALIRISGTDFNFVPLDVKENKNSIIEGKLKNINSLVDSCEKIFDTKYENLLVQIGHMYDKFYDIAFDRLTDGEKSEKARKVMKSLNPYKQVLDKLEDNLTEANELKRQLMLHDKKLNERLEEEQNELQTKSKEYPEQKDLFERDFYSFQYMASKYSSSIVSAVDRLNTLENKISEHYKTLDKLEISFKNAIPSEEEMKKYSSIGFKFQDLCVRLELAKSQINKGDKEMKDAVNTAITGLSTLIAYSTDIKGLYLRNSMVTATFKAVNALYQTETSENETIALSQNKFLKDNLQKYNELFDSFNSNMLAYRKVGNDTIRDVSIIMGKPITLKTLLELIDMVDISIKQIVALNEDMVKNNSEQIQTLQAILER